MPRIDRVRKLEAPFVQLSFRNIVQRAEAAGVGIIRHLFIADAREVRYRGNRPIVASIMAALAAAQRAAGT